MFTTKRCLIAGLAVALWVGQPADQFVYAQNRTEVPVDAKAIKKLQKKVEKNQDSLAYHKEFIKAMDIESPQLLTIYDKWIAKYPKNSTIPFAIGNALANDYSPKAKTYLLKAVALKPDLKEAYSALSIDADRWGDKAASRGYLLKASEIDPEDASAAFYYASSLRGFDNVKHRELSLAVAKKFNQSERGAQALYWLANETKDPVEKEAIYKQQLQDFSPAKFRWTQSGVSDYNNLLLKQNRFDDALALSQKVYSQTKDESWKKSVDINTALVKYAQAKAEGVLDGAIAILDGIQASERSEVFRLLPLYKAELLGLTKKQEEAYQLLMGFYTKKPSTAIRTALYASGLALNKSKDNVQADISRNLLAKAEVATAFELKNYSGSKTRLADSRGKVTFITYWYPGCGPCRGEFPHLENVVKHYAKDQLAFLGINISPKENAYVLPFMKTTGYSFTPLEDYKDRDKGNLSNGNAAPVNFIIDKKGNKVFSKFMIGANNEDELSLMLEEAMLL